MEEFLTGIRQKLIAGIEYCADCCPDTDWLLGWTMVGMVLFSLALAAFEVVNALVVSPLRFVGRQVIKAISQAARNPRA